MTTRALAADDEAIVNTDTYVSSALTFPVKAFLPAVDDGAGATVAVDYEIRVEATAGAPIRLATADGRLVGTVPGRGQVVVTALAGVQESETDLWGIQTLNITPITTIADAPAGGTGAAAGGWDTAGNRDLAIAAINNIIAALDNAGITKSE